MKKFILATLLASAFMAPALAAPDADIMCVHNSLSDADTALIISDFDTVGVAKADRSEEQVVRKKQIRERLEGHAALCATRGEWTQRQQKASIVYSTSLLLREATGTTLDENGLSLDFAQKITDRLSDKEKIGILKPTTKSTSSLKLGLILMEEANNAGIDKSVVSNEAAAEAVGQYIATDIILKDMQKTFEDADYKNLLES